MKVKHYIILGLLLILAGFVYFRYYWVFADGTKAGILNTFQKKGYLFKTYEGKIIQSGFKVNVQSNEFEFSVVSESVAKTLMENAGKDVELHYRSYFGALPWRGMQKFIVDSVYEVRGSNGETILSPKNK
ncbi:hypothetical protein HB364_08235 [Pseudoflavitalea sp. X16]|uniref:hypothetical protein n=1 Tax=Paraflavitalea devenefica TaxID=2716334 RepID=UPI0014232DEF|nr:hypothetical protein [Paraflavitalea devenefica]NII25063.1 hypothetical protein [Paraflavitalea devenefica]